MASHGAMASPEKKRQLKEKIEGELKEKQNQGHIVFWTNFTSSWQKICAGTGRAKRLGKGVLEGLEGLPPLEAAAALNTKTLENFGVAIFSEKKGAMTVLMLPTPMAWKSLRGGRRLSGTPLRGKVQWKRRGRRLQGTPRRMRLRHNPKAKDMLPFR